jgi:hypothetical protein
MIARLRALRRRPCRLPALGAVDRARFATTTFEIYALDRGLGPADIGPRLGRWLAGIEAPLEVLLLADRLDSAEIHPLGHEYRRALPPDLARLAAAVAAQGVVARRLLFTGPATAAWFSPAVLADLGLDVRALDERQTALVARRLLGASREGPDVATWAASVEPLTAADGGGAAGRGDGRARDAALERIAAGVRGWRQFALPDAVGVHPRWLATDDGAAVLLYVDGFPRHLPDSGLVEALRVPDGVDLCLRLWPLAGDAVIRYLTRRVRDLRSSRRVADDDGRVDTAIEDAERLREQLYLGETRLLQAAVILRVAGADPAQALERAARLRSRLGRLGFLARVAVLRQWPALRAMLPGAPDRLGAVHNVTSQAAAVLVPTALVAATNAGPLWGRDRIDHVAVHVDRTALANPAAAYLGAPGSGKSALAKMEILRRAAVAPDDRFVVIDPEGEYTAVVEAIEGGRALDVARPEGWSLPLVPALLPGTAPTLRAVRAATLLGPLVGATDAAAQATLVRALTQAIVDDHVDVDELPRYLAPLDADLAGRVRRAAAGVLRAVVGVGAPPTGLRAVSLNLSGVDTAALPALLPLLTEAALGHLRPRPPAPPAWLWLTLDEFHLFLERETGARLLVELAKRSRKRGIVLTAVSQHVIDLARHADGQAILAACEVLALFRPGVDVAPFAQAFRLDEAEAARLAELAPGEALVRTGGGQRLMRVALSERERALADTRPPALVAAARPTERAGGGVVASGR